MPIDRDKIIQAIGSSVPVGFWRFYNRLGDDRPWGTGSENPEGWHELFKALEAAERDGLLFIERAEAGTIEQLVLSNTGADRARGLLDQERGLLVLAEMGE